MKFNTYADMAIACECSHQKIRYYVTSKFIEPIDKTGDGNNCYYELSQEVIDKIKKLNKLTRSELTDITTKEKGGRGGWQWSDRAKNKYIESVNAGAGFIKALERQQSDLEKFDD